MKYIKAYESHQSTDLDEIEDILLSYIDDSDCILKSSSQYVKTYELLKKSEEIISKLRANKMSNWLLIKSFFKKSSDKLIIYSKQIQDEFNKICQNLNPVKKNIQYNTHEEIMYYNENGQWIFYYNPIDEYFYCSSERYWSIFEHKFNLTYDDIQQISHRMISKLLGFNIPWPWHDK